MAITTQFLPELANSTSFEIIKEFIYSYIDPSEIEIADEFPILDENFMLNVPMLVLEDMSGTKKNAGMGRQLSNGDKGQFKVASFMASWIVNGSVGGAPKLRYLADSLEYIFLVHSSDLSVAKLREAKCSSMRTIGKGTSSSFWGGRHLITAKVLLRY